LRQEFIAAHQSISSDVEFGNGVRIGSFVNLYGCSIGDEVTIGAFVEVQRGARVGNRCKIGSHSFICEGVSIGDGTYVGHGVMFTNDRYPRAVNELGEVLGDEDWELIHTSVGERVSIGSNVTILPGIRIGDGAVVGAGSVVTRDIPSGAVAFGNPARVRDEAQT